MRDMSDTYDTIQTALRHLPDISTTVTVWTASAAADTGITDTVPTAHPRWHIRPDSTPPDIPPDQAVPITLADMAVIMRVPLADLLTTMRSRHTIPHTSARLVTSRYLPPEQGWLATLADLMLVRTCMHHQGCSTT